MSSIKFCTNEMIGRFTKFKVISNYLKVKLEEVQRFNIENNITDESLNQSEDR